MDSHHDIAENPTEKEIFNVVMNPQKIEVVNF